MTADNLCKLQDKLANNNMELASRQLYIEESVCHCQLGV